MMEEHQKQETRRPPTMPEEEQEVARDTAEKEAMEQCPLQRSAVEEEVAPGKAVQEVMPELHREQDRPALAVAEPEVSA